VVGGIALSGVVATGFEYLRSSIIGQKVQVERNTNCASEVARMLADSPRIELSGSAVSYRLRLPEYLIKQQPREDLVEHVRQSPDNTFVVTVVAHSAPETVEGLSVTRLDALRKQPGVANAHLELTRTLEVNNVVWIESNVVLTMQNESRVRELAYATSSQHGFVMLVFSILASDKSAAAREKLCDEVIHSVTIE
jgi:hypothetical protein